MINQIQCMDCLVGLPLIASDSMDCILTNPPYGISYRSNHGSKEYKERIQTAQEWDTEFDFTPYHKELYRVLKPDSFMYVWGCMSNIPLMMSLGCDRILIWDKDHGGMGNLTDWGIGYEFLFVFKKGTPKIVGTRPKGVIKFTRIGYFEDTVHPTQKPVGLMRYILQKSLGTKGIVLDAFMGSGTTAIAAKQLGHDFIGFEKKQEYVDMGNRRVRAILEQRTLV